MKRLNSVSWPNSITADFEIPGKLCFLSGCRWWASWEHVLPVAVRINTIQPVEIKLLEVFFVFVGVVVVGLFFGGGV